MKKTMSFMSYQETTRHFGHKILLAGLSEAGKTAVKRIFFLKHTTDDVSNLSATINYERMSVLVKDVPVSILDLGGQTIFIRKFLDDLSPFIFSNIKAFIFIIDVENKSTRNNAIQYFSACFERLKEFSSKAEIFVFLHKNDLVINSPNYASIHKQLKSRFQGKCSLPIRFFRTTIYRPETVDAAFGRVFEVAMPHLAWSDLVNEKTIGVVEEFYEQADFDIESVSTAPRKVGDQAILEKLETMITKERISSDSKPENLSPEASQDNLTAVKELNTKTSTTPSKQSAYDYYSEKMMPSNEEIEEMVKSIQDFVKFYGIDPEVATRIMNSGYSEVFEAAVTSGIKVSTVLEVILKYIPRLQSEGLKTEILTPNRLMEIFSGFLKNSFKGKDELFKCLVYTIENPTLSFPDIINKYFFRETSKRKVRKSKRKAEKIPHEVAKFKIPFKVEINEGIITVPGTNGFGFEINLVNENAVIIFFFQERSIGNSLIPTTLNVDEITFLLAYETNMISLGYFEGNMISLKISARIIHEVKRILVEDSSSPPMKKTKHLKGNQKNFLQLDIPYEIPISSVIPEASYFILPETEAIAFTIIKIPEGYLLKVIQHKTPIGQALLNDQTNVREIQRILMDKLQVPIWPHATVVLSSQIVHAGLEIIIRADKKIAQQRLDPIHVVKLSNKKDEKTSDKLLSYLEKLEKE